ncbi:MAG: MurR/RpiR family transcriptional regulator [Alphaproteobacteria bacterium]|nr:MAG: MurR/RpiR family transcriptional regulator [Alphaproteobacteria bacterium]
MESRNVSDARRAAPADLEALAQALAAHGAAGRTQGARLAAWLADRPERLAFGSVRSIAAEAGVSPAAVVRLAKALGFEGFEAMREAARAAITQPRGYAERAAALAGRDDLDIFAESRRAAAANLEALFSAPMAAQIGRIAERLLAARAVHVVGVRSCYSLAHHLAYVGRMAFPNIQAPPALPGAILDELSGAGPGDVAVLISYAHYSAEVIRAGDIARDRGAAIIAVTDSRNAPFARGAAEVVLLPMEGPSVLPSLAAGMHLIELILAEMCARSPEASARIEAFEARLRRHGSYSG